MPKIIYNSSHQTVYISHVSTVEDENNDDEDDNAKGMHAYTLMSSTLMIF